ncbi:MAG: OmpA family protein [Steroidobacteraceae bacterium]
MKHRSLLLGLATVASLAGTSSALAGAEVGSWYVAPQAVYVDPDKVYGADENVGGSLAFGKVLSEAWDMELAYVDTRHDVNAGGDKLKLNGPSLNFNRVFMRDQVVNPFIGFGLNAISSRTPGTTKTQRDFGAAIKAGVLADITKDGALQLSAEIGKRSDDFTQHLEDVFGGLGLRFNFGGAKPTPVAAAPAPAPAPVAAPAPAPAPAPVAPPPPADSDRDGVINANDRCPNTPAGATVDANGCELDDDRDGVVNRLDRCPRTPAGDKVDTNGCGINLRLEVQFDTDKATIKPESYAELDAFVQFMKDVPSVKGELQGHTDNVGKDAYNLGLSQRRADSVKAYLVGKGVDGSRIGAKGIGEAQPVADNNTADGRATNRRVVFVRSDMAN